MYSLDCVSMVTSAVCHLFFICTARNLFAPDIRLYFIPKKYLLRHYDMHCNEDPSSFFNAEIIKKELSCKK